MMNISSRGNFGRRRMCTERDRGAWDLVVVVVLEARCSAEGREGYTCNGSSVGVLRMYWGREKLLLLFRLAKQRGPREGILLKSRHLSVLLMLVWNFNEDYSDRLLWDFLQTCHAQLQVVDLHPPPCRVPTMTPRLLSLLSKTRTSLLRLFSYHIRIDKDASILVQCSSFEFDGFFVDTSACIFDQHRPIIILHGMHSRWS